MSAPLGGTAIAFGGVPSGTYFLRMVAHNALGTSPPSNEITVVVPVGDTDRGLLDGCPASTTPGSRFCVHSVRAMTRAAFFRLHSWLGIVTGACMLAIAWSGALVVFNDEIEWLLNPAVRADPGAGPAAARRRGRGDSCAPSRSPVRRAPADRAALGPHRVRLRRAHAALPADRPGHCRDSPRRRHGGLHLQRRLLPAPAPCPAADGLLGPGLRRRLRRDPGAVGADQPGHLPRVAAIAAAGAARPRPAHLRAWTSTRRSACGRWPST